MTRDRTIERWGNDTGENITFSIICVYNDQSELEEMLLSWEEKQSFDRYEIVLIDNRDESYKSAAEALNQGAAVATGEYYVFVHQDVQPLTEDWLYQLEEYLSDIDDVGVAGVTGMAAEGTRQNERGRNTLIHGRNKEEWTAGNEISEPETVQTIDELCIISPSEVFDRFEFDSSLCPSWHLYGVEYCLRIANRTKYEPYVLPVDVWHGSDGMFIDTDYYETLKRIATEYREVDIVYTTSGSWILSPVYMRAIVTLSYFLSEYAPDQIDRKVKDNWRTIWASVIPYIWGKVK